MASVCPKLSYSRVYVSYHIDQNQWTLAQAWSLQCGSFALFIPAGYSFDLASVPRWFWTIIAPFELSLPAPLVHDYLYEFRGRPRPPQVDPVRTFTRLESDRLFLQIMQAEGIAGWKRHLAYRAVRLFGACYWNDE
ncbi:MAG: DUF1353 domain-containing protein [Puniceicoccaceae bacterium]